MDINRKGKGQCRVCSVETEDIWYVLCVPCCKFLLERERELRKMGQYDIDQKVYEEWLKDKVTTVESMTTREEIEARIIEIYKIEFLAKREFMMLNQRWDKINNRNGIPPWIRAERNALITNPHISVEYGEPRQKKEKKPKEDMVKNLLGFDIKELTASIKQSAKETSSKPGVSKEEKQTSLADAINQMLVEKPKVEAPKPTSEEIQNKAEAMRERIRLAKEAKEKKPE